MGNDHNKGTGNTATLSSQGSQKQFISRHDLEITILSICIDLSCHQSVFTYIVLAGLWRSFVKEDKMGAISLNLKVRRYRISVSATSLTSHSC